MKNAFRIQLHPEAIEWLERFAPIMEKLTVEVKPRGGAPTFLCLFLGLDTTGEFGDSVVLQRLNDQHAPTGDVFNMRVQSITIL